MWEARGLEQEREVGATRIERAFEARAGLGGVEGEARGGVVGMRPRASVDHRAVGERFGEGSPPVRQVVGGRVVGQPGLAAAVGVHRVDLGLPSRLLSKTILRAVGRPGWRRVDRGVRW